MAAKSKKQVKKNYWAARVIFTVVVIAALLISLIWAQSINRKLGLIVVQQDAFSGDSRAEVIDEGGAVVGIGGNLNVHFVDVGQGDACIIELPDGKTVLIDGGAGSAQADILNYIDTTIDDREQKFTAFDYAILTHSDEDHSGSIDNVLEKYPARVFYRPNILCEYSKSGYVDPAAATIKANAKYKSHDTLAYSRALTFGYNADKRGGITTEVRISDANNKDISVIKPSLPDTDPSYYELVFFAPVSNYYSDVNDYSPVIILEYQGNRMVLSGDAEAEAEEKFVEQANTKQDKYARFTDTYSVNVIKLGHHGSRTSSSKQYLETLTTPDTTDDVIIIISCGLDNKYGHPHKDVIERLLSLGFKEENFISTSKNGSLGLAIKGEVATGASQATYNLYFGADMLRFEKPKIGNDSVQLTWQEIVFSACIAIALAVIVLPLINQIKKNHRKAMRKAEQNRHKR